jgi:hypothetical protein
LSHLSDIQHWYNAVHARDRICGIYIPPWEAFGKLSDMGSTWSITHLDQKIIDRKDTMSAALNTLLSCKGIFKGECDDFTHIIINSSRNGYSALYTIVRMVHPLLGQVTTQPPQPAQRKNQDFSEHVTNYIGYFQSESCSVQKYSMNERVVLILSLLHPIWRDTMQRKYKQLPPQGGSSLTVPLECCQEMISVTLTQWCVEERLDLPSTKPVDSTPAFAVDSQVHDIFGPTADTTPGTIQFADRSINATTVDRAIAHAICYVDQARPNSVYPKCIACGLPGHTIEKCHPLINHCIAQALAAQHPEIVKRIKATCKMFPRSARGRPARPATVTQLIAELDLELGETSSEGPASNSIDHLSSPDLSTPTAYYGQAGTTLICFHN